MNLKNEKTRFLIASFLLQYPEETWFETLPEVVEMIKNMDQDPYVKCILKFLDYVRQKRALDLAELYVNTFDFAKKTNLYLSYYRYKEQKERGTALLALKHKFAKAGFVLQGKELPDFLPVILEFTSAAGTKEILMDYTPAVEAVYQQLFKDNNPYSSILEAVLLLVSTEANHPESLEEPARVSIGGGIL